MNRLLAFYRGQAPDDRFRTIGSILTRDDAWFEHTHDFIQWLFPLREASPVNPGAPTVDAEVIAAFGSEPALRERLIASFERMLRFYGLERRGALILTASNFPARKHDWFVRETHNDRRLTRILRSSATLGLVDEAELLLGCLETLRVTEPDCGVGATAFRYWRDALKRPL